MLVVGHDRLTAAAELLGDEALVRVGLDQDGGAAQARAVGGEQIHQCVDVLVAQPPEQVQFVADAPGAGQGGAVGAAEGRVDVRDAVVEHGLVRRALRVGDEQRAVRGRPLAQDVPAIQRGAGVLLFEVGDELRRQEGVVVDGILLVEDVHVGLDEGLEPVIRAAGVEGAVEQAVGLVEAALQQLEHIPRPVRDLVPVAVLDGRAAQLADLADLLRTQGVAGRAEQVDDVLAVDVADQAGAVDLAHGLKHVALNGRARDAEDHVQALAVGALPDAHGDHPAVVHVGLAGARRAALEVPAPVRLAQVFGLLRCMQHAWPPPGARPACPASRCCPRRAGSASDPGGGCSASKSARSRPG